MCCLEGKSLKRGVQLLERQFSSFLFPGNVRNSLLRYPSSHRDLRLVFVAPNADHQQPISISTKGFLHTPNDGFSDSRPLFSIVDCLFLAPFPHHHTKFAPILLHVCQQILFKRCLLNSLLQKNKSPPQKPRSMRENASKPSFLFSSTN